MSATEQRAGYEFELRCLKILREAGWWAIRTPASKSAVDILAIMHAPSIYDPPADGSIVLAVQCKRNGELGPEGWNALYDYRQYGAIPLLVYRPAPRVDPVWLQLTGYKLAGRRNKTDELSEIFEVK